MQASSSTVRVASCAPSVSTDGSGCRVAVNPSPMRAAICIAVVGPGDGATARDIADARAVGALCAARGWIVFTGGRNAGVMAAAAEGASSSGGVSIGLLPGTDRRDAAPSLTVSLPTGLGEARNAVLITAADAVIACGMSAGTLSEIALAIQARRPVALLGADAALVAGLGRGVLLSADSPEAAVEWIEGELRSAGSRG